ncbi:MAG: cytochrome c [Wenzhouxiangella sp.]|jgi:mono/diheme cytochrome c family protein|nr:cytochrome c [Wenzhouxiangella sp.]
MTFLKHALLTLFLAGLVGLGAAAWVISGGHFDVAVSAQLPKPIHDLVHLTRVNAVRREIRNLEAQPADLNNRATLQGAVQAFESLCAKCHSPPGGATPKLALSLNPPPADLADAAEKRSLAELFWVAKHGIRMSAMPAWGQSQSDETLWAIATLVQRFPTLSREEYQRLLGAAENVSPARPANSELGAQD